MHRTEGTNNVAGLFTDGPPATCVEANWLNSVQEEIAAVIEAATDNFGLALTLHASSNDTRVQLLAAVRYFQIQAQVVSTAERDLMTPRLGMFIYNTTTGKFQGVDGAGWTDFGAMA